jgi:hypothetical protein
LQQTFFAAGNNLLQNFAFIDDRGDAAADAAFCYY